MGARVDRIDFHGARLEKEIDEAARGRADVDDCFPAWVNRELDDGLLKLHAPVADVGDGVRPSPRRAASSSTSLSGFETRSPSEIDLARHHQYSRFFSGFREALPGEKDVYSESSQCFTVRLIPSLSRPVCCLRRFWGE